MEDYSDIINMPHHISKTHSQMSMLNRAAQFSPFAALTGYEAAIKDTEEENVMMRLNEEHGEVFTEDA